MLSNLTYLVHELNYPIFFVICLKFMIWEITIKLATVAGKDLEGQEDDLELPLFDLATISNATDNFSNSNKLGEGGFGAVFRVKFMSTKKNITIIFLFFFHLKKSL